MNNQITTTQDPTQKSNLFYGGTINVGGTAPKTDINAFNQQMVNAQPGQSNFNIPTTTTPTNTMANTTPAISSLSQYYDQPVSYLSEAMKYAQEKANTAIPTEEEARQAALKAMQAEIDATNTLYADKLRRAQQQGAGLLGQTGAIQARRGLLGSDFGTAQTQNVNTANEEVYSSIENEKLVKINQIQTKAKQDATAAIAEKRAAKEAGLKDYVDYLSKEKTLKDTAANATIQDMLANNIDLKDFSDSEIENLAKSYGLTGAKLKSTFAQAKKTITDAAAKTAAEQAKAGRMTVSEGQRVFQIDPKTGEYKQVAYNPKTYKTTTKTSNENVLGNTYTGGGSAETMNIIEKAKAIDPTIRGYAEALLAKNTTLSSIPNNLRNQVALATKTISDEKGVLVANQILKQLDNGIAALEKQGRSDLLSGSVAGASLFGLNPARFNQEVNNFRVVLDTLRAAQTINAIPLMKGTGPLSNADMRILENSQTELSETLDEATLLEKMQQLRNELEPAILGNKPGATMQPVGGVNASPANQPTMSEQVRAEAEAKGYDYDQMVADGLSDEEIMSSL